MNVKNDTNIAKHPNQKHCDANPLYTALNKTKQIPPHGRINPRKPLPFS